MYIIVELPKRDETKSSIEAFMWEDCDKWLPGQLPRKLALKI